MSQNRQYLFNMSYLDVFGMLTGVEVDVWKFFGVWVLNTIHSSVYISVRFHLYIFFTMFCVHSFFVFVFLFIMLIWCPTVVSQHLSKCDKRGWLTRWPPWSFANPIWHNAPLCLHWSAIVPLWFHLVLCSLMVSLLHAMAFMVLLLVGWVIRNNKPLPLLHIVFCIGHNFETIISGEMLGAPTQCLTFVLYDNID